MREEDLKEEDEKGRMIKWRRRRKWRRKWKWRRSN